ncbi:MAG: TAXI family TRAP transporter solute-binding subunit [Bdellovibrionota bacterium]
MNKTVFFAKYSVKDALIVFLPCFIIVVGILWFAYLHLDPAPPNHLTISTGEDQSDLQVLAKEYQDILKQNGVRLDIKSSNGPMENLRRLQDENAGVDAAFVQDGLGSAEAQPDISSLGSLYYEPVWIFYRTKEKITHFSQLEGKRLASGREGHATHVIIQRLLKLNGVDASNTKILHLDAAESAKALIRGEADAAAFLLPPDDPLIRSLALRPELHLMNVTQAEAISRRDAAFHHLVLPRGAIDLNADEPSEDINLVSSTGTLLVRDDLHPALAYLLLKAASQIHDSPGVFERRGEFPSNKDDAFPLSDDAIQYYKSGGSFWQRLLPYWLAAWFDRFILLVIPILAFVLPLFKVIPNMYHWRLRSKIYQRYGELKHIETEITPDVQTNAELLKRLDLIEDRVNRMKMPKNFAEYIYSLKGHIQFVRDRLRSASNA